jgi:hypothetical protein
MDCDEKRLLKRMVPSGFLAYLRMPTLSRMEEEQLDELERDIEENIPEHSQNVSGGLEGSDRAMQQGAAGTNTSRLRSRMVLASATVANGANGALKENFRIFFHVLTKDHTLADLQWSQQQRRELRVALETEIQYIQRETEARGLDAIAWCVPEATVFSVRV